MLAGWGLASDAHHLTQPDPGGSGAAGAIREALRDGADDLLDEREVLLLDRYCAALPERRSAARRRRLQQRQQQQQQQQQ